MRPLVLAFLVLCSPSFAGPIAPPKPGDGNRELAAKLLDAIEAGADDQQLEVLDWLDTQRQANNFLWNWDERPLVDRNAIEFLTQTLSAAWIEERPRAAPAAAERWRAFLKLNLAGVRAHRVSVEYTNIFLMKAANLVALGRGLDDPAAVEEGAGLLKQWDQATSDHGIAEFLSPTYTAVDLTDLGLLLRFAPDADLRALAQRCLDRVWSTVLVHWMEPSGRLGGAHSRDYDRLTGHGPLDAWVAHLRHPEISPGGALDRLAFAGPSVPIAPLAPGQTERLRWGPDAWATWYRGPTWGIGSADRNYHDMDKTLLVADLGGGPDVPVVSMLMEGRGDFYGTAPVLEAGSGHWKSLHLMPRQASIQDGPRVLAAAAQAPGTGRVETTLVLPARAVYRLGGVELHPTGGRSLWKADPAPVEPATSVTVNPDGSLQIADDDPHRGVGESALVSAIPGHRYRTTVIGSGRALMVYHNYLAEGRTLVDRERAAPLQAGTNRTTVFETVAPPGSAWVRLWLYSTTAQTGGYRVASAVTEDVTDPSRPVEINRWDGEPPVPFDAEVPTGSVLTVTVGTASLALRPLIVTDTSGRPTVFHLINDGADRGAYRLTADQSAGGPDAAVTVLWAEAAETPDTADVRSLVAQTAARPLDDRAAALARSVRQP